MRTFEILTFVTLLVSLTALLLIRKKPRWFNYLPGFTLAMVLCHAVFEGVRWQMIPAYLFVSALFLISLKQIFSTKKEQSERRSVFKRILRISGTVITFILFVIILIPPLEVPMFRIPHPTGKFKVGSSILFFRDTTRIDAFSPEKNRFRELSVRVWYPASPCNSGKRMPYMQTDEGRYLAIYTKGAAFTLSHFNLIKTDSYFNAEPLKGPFPVILYSPSGCIVENTTLFQELASHGYIVFSVCHPYWNAFHYDELGKVVQFDVENAHYKSMWEEEDSSKVISIKEDITNAKDLQLKKEAQQLLNKYMPEEVADIRLWAEDNSFLMDRIEYRASDQRGILDNIDTSKVGAIGFSKGGVATGQFCVTDNRCKAGINLSGFMFGDAVEKPFTRPFMIMESVEPSCTDCDPICDLFYKNSLDASYMVRINDARHVNFSDFSLLGGINKLSGNIGPINGKRFLKIQNDYVLAFFNQYLKGEPSDLLNDSTRKYEEVVFKSRNTQSGQILSE
jgi:predicted dienelactone hydrolase